MYICICIYVYLYVYVQALKFHFWAGPNIRPCKLISGRGDFMVRAIAFKVFTYIGRET